MRAYLSTVSWSCGLNPLCLESFWISVENLTTKLLVRRREAMRGPIPLDSRRCSSLTGCCLNEPFGRSRF
uniref:Uncharacterized protein n=1 Tax=Physcomitrium patens TaxID=3218 RepID=A0A7I3Z8H8_PHYPA